MKIKVNREAKEKISSSGARNVTSESSPNSRDTTMAMQTLDPNCILDIERSARHLATSVDEMVENLSGLLQGILKKSFKYGDFYSLINLQTAQFIYIYICILYLIGISALTVDTVETYRDGVCKTCDAVDGNIKSMYQVSWFKF